MRALLALLAAAFLVAGCVETTSTTAKDAKDLQGAKGQPGAQPTPGVRLPLPAKISFAPPVVLGTRSGGVEPSVATAPDGTVYITTPNNPGLIWRSDDGGKTYKGVGSPYCPNGLPTCPGMELHAAGNKGAGDADLWVTPDGNVHWLGLFDGQNAIPYQVSKDKGATWSAVNDLAGEDSADREWITGRADGTVIANWRNFPAASSGKKPMIVMRASYDGGNTWTPATDIAPDTRQGGVAVDPSSKALALAHDLNGAVSSRTPSTTASPGSRSRSSVTRFLATCSPSPPSTAKATSTSPTPTTRTGRSAWGTIPATARSRSPSSTCTSRRTRASPGAPRSK